MKTTIWRPGLVALLLAAGLLSLSPLASAGRAGDAYAGAQVGANPSVQSVAGAVGWRILEIPCAILWGAPALTPVTAAITKGSGAVCFGVVELGNCLVSGGFRTACGLIRAAW